MIPFRWENLLALLAAIACAPAANAADSGTVHYALKDLKPMGITEYALPTRAAVRKYLHFDNTDGRHYLVYEEAMNAQPAGWIPQLRNMMTHPEVSCSLELDCKRAAFCTGSCKNLYYETSNTPGDLELNNRNHCNVMSYHCK